MKVYQSFDVGFFDLIVAGESRRSIYHVHLTKAWKPKLVRLSPATSRPERLGYGMN